MNKVYKSNDLPKLIGLNRRNEFHNFMCTVVQDKLINKSVVY